MPTSYTPLLGLALPTQGELSGTWGDVENASITNLVDTAVAGTTALNTDLDVTLTATTGTANQARSAIILCGSARTALRYITAPASSKVYTVVNNTTGGFAVVLRGVGPTTGVSIANGASLTVVWNGSDFVIAETAMLYNTALSGVPTAPTAAPGANTTQLASTAFVTAAAALKADLASPTFTGDPKAPTPTLGDSDTSIATTGFVAVHYARLDGPTFTGTVTIPAGAVIAGYAPLVSPALAGTPTAPTAASVTSNTQVATTAFVQAVLSGGSVSAGAGQIRETFTATASQTVFTLVNSYVVGGKRLNIYINGVRQFDSAYTETNTTTVTFSSGLTAGDVVLFENILVTVGAMTSAASVSYNATVNLSASTVQEALTTLSTRGVEPLLLMSQGVI